MPPRRLTLPPREATPAPPTRQSTAIPRDTEFAHLLRSWFLALSAANRSPETIDSYDKSARSLYWFLVDHGMPTDPEHITREYIEMYLVELGQRTAPGTVAFRFRSLAALFSWALKNDRLTVNPMARLTRPSVKTAPPPVLTDDDVRSILATCRSRSFIDRRDRAILLIFFWIGARLGEVASLDLADVDLSTRMLHIEGKTDPRDIRLPREAATALDDYLFARGKYLGPGAHTTALWLGQPRDGYILPLSKHGIAEMIGRRARRAGLKANPHLYRHTFAANWMNDRAGDEQNLMEIGGWKSGAMLSRYGRATRAQRANDAIDDWAEGRARRR